MKNKRQRKKRGKKGKKNKKEDTDGKRDRKLVFLEANYTEITGGIHSILYGMVGVGG